MLPVPQGTGLLAASVTLITGLVTSCTVKLTTQVVSLLAASLTVTVIGCAPAPCTVVPSIGLWVIVRSALAVQLSEDFARTASSTLTTPASQLPSAMLSWLDTLAQSITGCSLSSTVTVKVQVLLLSSALLAMPSVPWSRAVQVTG